MESTDLRRLLEDVYSRYHREGFIGTDPLEFPRRFRDPADQETIAVVAAQLAYGNVKQIRASLESLLARIHASGLDPAAFAAAASRRDARARNAARGFRHRFHGEADLLGLLELVALSREKHGSVGRHFSRFLDPSAENIGGALSGWLADWKDWATALPRGPSFGHLLSSPTDGSSCKRWCLFLRWMIRKDALDLGLWSKGGACVDGRGSFACPAQLVIPVDTHIARISRRIGLTSRQASDWKTSIEITRALAMIDPGDPVRFDFALTRIGILRQDESVNYHDLV